MMGYVFMRFGTAFRPENVDRLREKVGECLERAGIFGSTAFLLLNLMDELICNILEHGKATWVELEVHPRSEEVTLTFRDDGPRFDPSQSMGDSGPQGALDLGEGRNMGLYIIKQNAKSWEYKYLNGNVNELNLVVELDKSSEGKS